MNEALADLIGMQVTVYSHGAGHGSAADSGVLEAYTHPWVRIRTSPDSVLCFAVYSVRLIKPLEPVRERKVEPDRLLLRPVGGGDEGP